MPKSIFRPSILIIYQKIMSKALPVGLEPAISGDYHPQLPFFDYTRGDHLVPSNPLFDTSHDLNPGK